jgi:NADH:ubiquinone oxidoreductase subunit 5 (subunit L)/multisubunit Na+/H+ antiporter MnhA subunit
MEAPAPASALIHSATLVSAGIFLILRMAPLFELSILSSTLIPAIGAITAFYGGVVSAAQTDVKKILAYSTISHCGFMVLLSATFNLDLVLIYLYVHGFFKALLFLAAGSVMRFFKGQDFRYMGGAYKYLPVECIISIFGFWHLSGGPLSFGYAAKHYIITSLEGNTLFTTFIIINVLISILASIIYSSRFVYFVYFDFKKAKKPIYSEHCSNLLLSKHFTLSSRAGALVLLCNYAFVIIMCTYLLTLWGPSNVTSPVTYNILTNISNPLASEIVSAGPSIINPVVTINYIAFIFF